MPKIKYDPLLEMDRLANNIKIQNDSTWNKAVEASVKIIDDQAQEYQARAEKYGSGADIKDASLLRHASEALAILLRK